VPKTRTAAGAAASRPSEPAAAAPTPGATFSAGIKVGYARVSTDAQDLTAQRQALAALGVTPERIYVDHGLTGTNRDRPGLRQALAACRAGDTLVVTKLDRLARSVPDAGPLAPDVVVELSDGYDILLFRRVVPGVSESSLTNSRLTVTTR
jgi:hypothetical protein